MKKLLLMLSCCMATWCNAQTFLKYDSSSSASSNVPQKTVEEVSDGVIVTYTFGGATITKDDLYTSSYNWDIQGFTANSTVTNPAILQTIDQVQIPGNSSTTLTILNSTYVDYRYELAPARPYLPNDDTRYTKDNVKPIASYSGFYPASIVSTDEIVSYRGNRLQNVLVYPVQYNMQTKTVRAYKQIQYKITFGSSLKKSMAIPKDVNTRLLNKYTLGTSISNGKLILLNQPESYLILTSSKYLTAANTLAAWKRLMGFKTYVVSNSTWTTDLVRSTIRSYYDSYDIQYMLIIGDHEDVPAEAGASYSTHHSYTDYNYCCMDGDDDKVADIFRGRLSVSTAQEATDVVDKIINYEKNPVTDSNFYGKYLCAAYFQTENNTDTRESRQFILTSETVIATPGLSAKTPTRAYKATCNNPIYKYNNQALPTFLQKPNYAWTANGTDISNAINSGVFFSLYRGHGNSSALASLGFNNNHANNLNNGNKLPVMFNITCLSGKFTDSKCLAEALLRKADGGAAAVLASQEVSYSGVNDNFTKGIFDAFWPKNTSNEPIYRIGEAIDNGLAYMAQNSSNSSLVQYTRNVFHCFGDPSMMLTTEVPTAFTDVTVTRGSSTIKVTLPSGVKGQITISGIGNDEVQSHYGNSAIFNISNFKSLRVQLCISGHNKIPYFKTISLITKPITTCEITGISVKNNIVNVSLKMPAFPLDAYVEIAPVSGGYSPIKTEVYNKTTTTTLSVQIPLNYPSGMYYAKLYYNGVLKDTEKFVYGISRITVK